MRRFQELETEQRQLSAVARDVAKDIPSWESVEKKRAAWRIEDRVAEADREGALAPGAHDRRAAVFPFFRDLCRHLPEARFGIKLPDADAVPRRIPETLEDDIPDLVG